MEKERGRIDPKKGEFGRLPMAEPEFPQLTAIHAFDRQQHIQRSMDAGMTREQAERHADEHLDERADASE